MNRLKTLRRKFMVVNMVTITLMLLIIFGIFIGVNINHYKAISIQALQNLVNTTNPVNALTTPTKTTSSSFQDANRNTNQGLSVEQNSDNPEDQPPPQSDSTVSAKNQRVANTLPGLVVQVDEDYSEITVLFSRNIETNEAIGKEIIQQIKESGKPQGFLSSHNLAYSVHETPEGIKIALVDCSYQVSSMRTLFLTSLAVFILSWLVFFLLAWRLSIWALRPVEEAWRTQRQFIADASHELKTPLTVILANTHILRTHENDTIKSQERWLDSSYSEALHMKRLIEEMLFLARNDASELEVKAAETFSLSDIVTGITLSFESVALENGLFIEEDIEDDLILHGEAGQLKELCTILLDNACKYAPKGTTIDVILKEKDKHAQLRVSNALQEGANLDTTRLFERFYRAESDRNRQSGGYGLGLSIADSITARHKGTIKASVKDNRLTISASFPV